MLTKDDLNQIKKVIDPVKKDVAQTRKDVKYLFLILTENAWIYGKE